VNKVDSVRRVALIGAECVGKTTLCQNLAGALPGLQVAEYLREFCELRGRTPLAGEQAHILEFQIEREARIEREAAAKGLRWVLCDSAPIVTALYSLMLFDDDTLLEPALAHHHGYRSTLLLAPDLPWIADGIQRDGPRIRAQFDELLNGTLKRYGIEYLRIQGDNDARISFAQAALARQPSDL